MLSSSEKNDIARHSIVANCKDGGRLPCFHKLAAIPHPVAHNRTKAVSACFRGSCNGFDNFRSVGEMALHALGHDLAADPHLEDAAPAKTTEGFKSYEMIDLRIHPLHTTGALAARSFGNLK
jgi:hypothetical protein